MAREVRRYRTWRLHRNDLFQAGMLGVVEAASRFDPRRGPFAPYAAAWVRKEVQRAMADGEFAVVLPSNYPGRAVSVRRVLHESGGDMRATALRLGLSVDVTSALFRALDDVDTIEGRNTEATPSAEDEAWPAITAASVHRAVRTLPHRQRVVVILRYGLDGRGERSCREIARQIGISDFTVRSLLDRAARALRPLLADLDPTVVASAPIAPA